MLIFVVARTRLARYEGLRREFQDSQDVRIILDRREGERRAASDAFAGNNRRRVERRRRRSFEAYAKLGWSVIDTDEPPEESSSP